ncbi:MAG: high-potential iron-sulfur protein [Sulfuricaulis sp.]
MNDAQNPRFTRREILKAAVLLTTAVTALSGATQQALADNKASKAAMQYRDKPNAKKECSNCMQFIPGKTPKAMGTCKVVAGKISPHGWCLAYAPKS